MEQQKLWIRWRRISAVAALSVLLCAPGENLRSSDRATATPLRHNLLEDAALEHTDGCFPEVGRCWLPWQPLAELLFGAIWCLSAAAVVSGGVRLRSPFLTGVSLCPPC